MKGKRRSDPLPFISTLFHPAEWSKVRMGSNLTALSQENQGLSTGRLSASTEGFTRSQQSFD